MFMAKILICGEDRSHTVFVYINITVSQNFIKALSHLLPLTTKLRDVQYFLLFYVLPV